MVRTLRTIGLAVAVLCSFLSVTAASAQGRDPAAARSLNGHTFIPSSLIGDPFITTALSTQTGGGIARGVSRDVKSEALDEVLKVLAGDLAFMALEFDYELAVED